MDGKEDEECGKGLEDSKPETAAKETDVERGVDASELVEAVLRKSPCLLDPSEGPCARQSGRRSSEAIVRCVNTYSQEGVLTLPMTFPGRDCE